MATVQQGNTLQGNKKKEFLTKNTVTYEDTYLNFVQYLRLLKPHTTFR